MKSYKSYFSDRGYIVSFTSGVLFLAASLVLQFLANNYAARAATGFVGDIVLSNTRVYDVDMIFVYGTVLLFFITLFICLRKVNYLPFITKSVGLFTLIRSVFISLTHISTYPTHAIIESKFFLEPIFRGIFTGDGLFFSGHTGLPFLFALIFWENKYVRIIFLSFSVVMAVVVLLGHLHYSIDVLSAYFITYSIFHISIRLFKKDWEMFQKNLT